ncbi:integrator complex subunit 12-like [Athalia rosae]|uniref:integrator complex subunit 12-like n=1 Tax=Athalia rosae TaxID=37344 RepID=UPI0020340699|nr:integrator complex subunit 12-like [Athalia rosae]
MQMYNSSDLDNVGELDEDFLAALSLLHSTDDDSAEKLRQMLDTSIAKKYGPAKTLAVRMRCRSSSPTMHELPGNRDFQSNGISNQDPLHSNANTQFVNLNDGPGLAKKAKGAFNTTTVQTYDSFDTAIVTTNINKKMTNILVEVDRMDIPTISIPDEGSSAIDGALCKVCNGARLGPLILLECQECEDVYHPLCHQPPVLDLDIYDPRLVWHCAKCDVELSDAATIIAADHRDKKFQMQNSIGMEISKNEPRTSVEMICDNINEPHNYFRRTKTRLCNYRHGQISGTISSCTM